ncbi:hypothetical protein OS493_015151 [Desmophyllum pertusum]|uniref:Ig-like domain-containing protein n=1 Tax=Desmophyllum pertusum TaxID=174260 RepID=A0A9W9ZQJ3_9CNID|nr:hypothetical protein OS493_015151 [Desmophyllum pertusum]
MKRIAHEHELNMKLLLEGKHRGCSFSSFLPIFAEVSLSQETGTRVTLETDGTRLITVPEGHYVEMTITFPIDHGSVCYLGVYFEIRDGLNQSANLLGVFCGFYKDKEYVFRSSGRHMWLRFHRYHTSNDNSFHVKYTSKQMNVTVAPVLTQVKTTQFVLYNHSSFLWCPAEGAPAPVIFWRKNGIVVQNTTSVRYKLRIVKGNNVTYSCEVKNKDQLTKKEFVLYIERCPGPCQCKHRKGTHSLLSVLCGGKQLKSFPWTLPLTTYFFNLSNNRLQQLPKGVLSNNTELTSLLLTNNQLQQLPEGVFSSNTKLDTLSST